MDRVYLRQVISDQQGYFVDDEQLVKRLIDLSEHIVSPEVSVITGVRRCGKSTLMKLVGRQVRPSSAVCYLDLDDSRLIDFSVGDFQAAFEIWLEQQPSAPERISFFYDEIQNVSGWERWVTQLAKNKKYKVFVSGSNSEMLSNEFATHLTGRHRDVELTPFSFREILQLELGANGGSQEWLASTEGIVAARRALTKYLQFGGFPRAFIGGSTTMLPEYFKDIVENDVAQRHQVRNQKALRLLARLLLTDATKITNKTRIAELLGLKKQASVSEYCHHLEGAYLVFEVKAFNYSLQKQIRSLPKYYPVDQVLAREIGFGFTANDGAALEMLVFLELRRRGFEVFYWNSKKGYGVDFILVRGTKVVAAIQVCVSLSQLETKVRELRGLAAAAEELKVEELIVVTRDESMEAMAEGRTVRVVSFTTWAVEQ